MRSRIRRWLTGQSHDLPDGKGPDTIQSIAKGLPDAKFLMLVREPLQRLWSALCMKARNGRISPADRIRYWFFDDIVRRPDRVVNEMCGFIDVEPRAGSISTSYNKKQGKYKVAVSPAIRAKLVEMFAAEYQACARVFGGHAVDWTIATEA